MLRTKHAGSKFLLAGDGNIHLSYLAQHHQSCTCSHCQQSTVDKQIEAMLNSANLHANNPPVPTHCSGTAPHLILTPSTNQVPTDVHLANIGNSDHRITASSLPLQQAP